MLPGELPQRLITVRKSTPCQRVWLPSVLRRRQRPSWLGCPLRLPRYCGSLIRFEFGDGRGQCFDSCAHVIHFLQKG